MLTVRGFSSSSSGTPFGAYMLSGPSLASDYSSITGTIGLISSYVYGILSDCSLIVFLGADNDKMLTMLSSSSIIILASDSYSISYIS